jgi:hypothetical protein
MSGLDPGFLEPFLIKFGIFINMVYRPLKSLQLDSLQFPLRSDFRHESLSHFFLLIFRPNGNKKREWSQVKPITFYYPSARGGEGPSRSFELPKGDEKLTSAPRFANHYLLLMRKNFDQHHQIELVDLRRVYLDKRWTCLFDIQRI